MKYDPLLLHSLWHRFPSSLTHCCQFFLYHNTTLISQISFCIVEQFFILYLSIAYRFSMGLRSEELQVQFITVSPFTPKTCDAEPEYSFHPENFFLSWEASESAGVLCFNALHHFLNIDKPPWTLLTWLIKKTAPEHLRWVFECLLNVFRLKWFTVSAALHPCTSKCDSSENKHSSSQLPSIQHFLAQPTSSVFMAGVNSCLGTGFLANLSALISLRRTVEEETFTPTENKSLEVFISFLEILHTVSDKKRVIARCLSFSITSFLSQSSFLLTITPTIYFNSSQIQLMFSKSYNNCTLL